MLYDWPPAARFGRVVPKTRFYEHGRVSTRLREQFVADIARITWAFKLADETIHLRGTPTVPEIQIFSIELKAETVSADVLTAIDKSIPFPIIFEINRQDGDGAVVRMAAAHKTLSGTTPRLSRYFETARLPAGAPRLPLPTALDLPTLYARLLTPLLPAQLRPGEDVAAAISRLDEARKLEREIAGLERRLRTEPQLNRKVELRRQLKSRAKALSVLTDSETP